MVNDLSACTQTNALLVTAANLAHNQQHSHPTHTTSITNVQGHRLATDHLNSSDSDFSFSDSSLHYTRKTTYNTNYFRMNSTNRHINIYMYYTIDRWIQHNRIHADLALSHDTKTLPPNSFKIPHNRMPLWCFLPSIYTVQRFIHMLFISLRWPQLLYSCHITVTFYYILYCLHLSYYHLFM